MACVDDVETERQDFYFAGQIVDPGTYQRIDCLFKLVEIVEKDRLPASCDGRVACYRKVTDLWGQISHNHIQQDRNAA